METWAKNKISNLFKKKYKYDPLIVAEVSANHNKNINNVIKIIKSAKKIGIDAIKIQLYKPDEITLNVKSSDFNIKKNNTWGNRKSYYDLYKKGSTPYNWYSKLKNICDKNKIILFSSVFDLKTVDFLEKNKCPIYKIASPEITDLPLISKVAKTRKPIFISTGLASQKDIELALKILKKNKCNKIVVMKCTSAYPAPINEINLKTMQNYEKKFKVKTGFSDHTLGETASIVATTLGARVIEKHIMLNKKTKSLDSFFSLSVNEFKNFVNKIKDTKKCIGKVNYEITTSALKNIDGRKSLYVSKDIKKGQYFSEENIKSVRPSYGLHPKYFFKILKKRCKKNMRRGERLTLSTIK